MNLMHLEGELKNMFCELVGERGGGGTNILPVMEDN